MKRDDNLTDEQADRLEADGIGLDDKPQLRVVNASELLTLKIPPREYILEPILQTQSTSMLFAQRGFGKTYFALGLAASIAAGTSFLKWRAPKPRKIGYVDGEMPGTAAQFEEEINAKTATIDATAASRLK